MELFDLAMPWVLYLGLFTSVKNLTKTYQIGALALAPRLAMSLLLALAMAMAQATESTTTNLCKRQWWANCSLFDMAGTPHGFRCPPTPTNIDENGQCGSIYSWHAKHIKWILLSANPNTYRPALAMGSNLLLWFAVHGTPFPNIRMCPGLQCCG